MTSILGFTGEYRFLSNFWLVPIVIDDIEYKSSEHYYMAQKTTVQKWRDLIMVVPTGAKAKQIGKTVPLRANWHEKYKMQSMLKGVLHKFMIPEMWTLLDATGDVYLEETNWWNDTFWGVCDGVGKNWLGRILMFTRDTYRINNVV